MDVDSVVNCSREIGGFGLTGGCSSYKVGCKNAELAAFEALTVVNANELASNNDVKILLPPCAEGTSHPWGCIKNASQERTWNVKGACIEESRAAAGGRNTGYQHGSQKPAKSQAMKMSSHRGRSSRALGTRGAYEAP